MVEDRFRLGDAFRALNGTPDRAWPAGVIHHGARVLILLGLAFVVLLLFPVSPVPDFPVLERGMVAEEDVIAQVAFPIYKTEAELARERSEAAAGVAPIVDERPEAVDAMLAQADGFFDRLEHAVAEAPDEAQARRAVRDLLVSYGFDPNERVIGVLQSARDRTVLADAVELAIRRELPAGIMHGFELEGSVAPNLRIRHADGSEELVARDTVLTASRFFQRAAAHLPPGVDSQLRELHGLVLIRFFEPSLVLNREATETARDAARAAVPIVKEEILRGQRIVRAHEQVRDAEIERLRAYQAHLAELGQFGREGGLGRRAAGGLLYNFLILSIFGFLLFFFRRDVYETLRQVVLIAAVILAFLGGAAIIGRTEAPMELIPIAFPALVLAALWNGRMALNLALVLAVLLAGQAAFLGVSVLFTTVVGGAAAAFCVRVVRSRAQTWVFISIIAAAYVLAAITLGLLRAREFTDILWSAGWGTMNAVGSAILAMGFLPLFEAFTRITTDQTLLELSDLNRPLLKRLSLEAPGTYAHSINVANLAEAAARAIGANALLTRVGVYYHDVGKMVKPQYFIENQPQGRNPHDKLKPAMSAAIVRGHVIEGLRLADEAKLPDVVKAFIPEHHGTQPISFFYDRARELDPDGELEAADYAYPGPRPRSKETAIAMLADAAESATRVLQDPTPERIRALVDHLVDGKIAQGQLDEAPLTLGEITRIKETIAGVLSGMYHHRIDYPSRPPADRQAALPGAGSPQLR